MRKSVKTLVATGIITAAMASAPMVFAAPSSHTQDAGPTGQMMHNNGRMGNSMGMMGGGNMMTMQRNNAQDSGPAGPMMGNGGRMGNGMGMMNGGGMMAMMQMMGRMNQMMANCNQMMQGMMGMTGDGMMNRGNGMPMMQGRMGHGSGGQSQ